MQKVQAVIESLENAPAIVIPLVREVPTIILKRRPKPGKWSAHEHACHLPTIQPMILGRLDLMLSESSPWIKPYFPDADEEDGALLKVELDEAMTRFTRERERMVERLKALSPADWERTAKHGEYNRYSVFIMFRHIAMHDLFHAYRIEELLLKKDWE